MPRRKGSASSSFAIRQFRRQAGSVLAKLRKDIRAKEMELVGLKREEAALSQIAGRATAGGAAVARAPRAAEAVEAAADGSTGAMYSDSCPSSSRPPMFDKCVDSRTSALQKSSPQSLAGSKPAWSSARPAASTKKPSARAVYLRFRIVHCRGSAVTTCTRTLVTALPQAAVYDPHRIVGIFCRPTEIRVG